MAAVTPPPATIQTKVLRSSTGPVVSKGDTIWVWYEGELLNGTRFDSNFSFSTQSQVPNRQAFSFTLGQGRVIQGWEQGLVGRRLGEVVELTIPSSLAYGSKGSGSIPANATLRFKVELLGGLPAGKTKSEEIVYPTPEQRGYDLSPASQYLTQIKANKIGFDGNETITGSSGNDLLVGLKGNDIMSGGAGDDVFLGGLGNDTINGESGVDLIVFGASNNTVNLATKSAQVTGEGTDVIIAIENVAAGAGDDKIYGDDLQNVLDGGVGNDFIQGGKGQDRLIGGAGNDIFKYVANSDSLLTSCDWIQDFAIGSDAIDGIIVVAKGNVKNLGSVKSLAGADVQARLTTKDFTANSACVFTHQVGSVTRTFVAMNDRLAGFSAAQDCIIEITGYTGALSNLAII